jgi:hypothetical protein
MAATDSRNQINVRLSEEQIKAIDKKRVETQRETGVIPTRSDVLRLALDAFVLPQKTTKKQV